MVILCTNATIEYLTNIGIYLNQYLTTIGIYLNQYLTAIGIF